jgi:uncharacterized membrane protein SpoIIM required for sporulation
MKTTQNPSFLPFLCRIGFVFVLGMATGCLAAHVLRNNLYASVFQLYQTLSEQLKTVEIDRKDFFLLALRKNLKYFLLLSFFAFTNVWKYYYRIFLMYCGFQNGLLLSFCVQMNKTSGIAGYFCFLLPQALLLIPAFLLAFVQAKQVNALLQDSPKTPKKVLLCRLPFWLLALLLLIMGCLAEAALNPSLLRLYFQ